MVAEVKTRTDEDRVDITKLIPLNTPLNILVDPASACNIKCNFCPTSDIERMRRIGKFRGVMKFDLYKKIIDELSLFPAKIKNLHLTKDGEPMLNKYLPQMVSYAKESGSVEQVTITTNALLLTPERSKSLVEAGLDRIRISLEGMSKEDYKRVAKADIDFEELVKNIKYFYSVKKDCSLYIKVPEDCITEEQGTAFFELFEDYADTAYLEHIVPAALDFELPDEYKTESIRGMFQQEYTKKNVCGFIFYTLAVSAEGFVSPCCVDWAQELLIGDANKQTLKEIWESDDLKKLSFQHLEGNKNDNPVCAKCDAPSLCCLENLDPHREEILLRFKQQNPDFVNKILDV